MPTADKFVFLYSIINIIAGTVFVLVEIWGVQDTQSSTTFIGGIGVWLLISALMVMKKNKIGLVIRLFIAIFVSLAAIVFMWLVVKDEYNQSITISAMVLLWAVFEWLYVTQGYRQIWKGIE